MSLMGRRRLEEEEVQLTEVTKGFPMLRKGEPKSQIPQRLNLRHLNCLEKGWLICANSLSRRPLTVSQMLLVLAFAKPAKPYLLHMKASASGLGDVLNREPKGLRPVAFEGCTLQSVQSLCRCNSKRLYNFSTIHRQSTLYMDMCHRKFRHSIGNSRPAWYPSRSSSWGISLLSKSQ